MNEEVLAMYDVRGIQNYIFKTNRIKEIIGASLIVDNIIMKGLKEVVKDKDKHQFLTEWEKDEADAFIREGSDVQMQVLFIGGGNAYVLFRNETICKEINQKLAKYVLNETYSLNLAVAIVKKTDSYKDNYKEINAEMRKVKAEMGEVKPLGAMPFMQVDSMTGFPLTGYDSISKKDLCTESLLKRKIFEKGHKGKEENQLLDDMVTEKGDSSFLAVVHIDGNNMGLCIKQCMSEISRYEDAIPTIRQISKNINNGFLEAYDKAIEKINALAPKIKEGATDKELCRKIVTAGDDITFICNAKAAIPAVEAFIKSVVEKYMDADMPQIDGMQRNSAQYRFSACAGIAFFNSHFPFTDAYKVAEACCDKSAKYRAKDENRCVNGKTGSFFDYQVCTHIKSAHIESYREQNYTNDAGSLIYRPYYIPNGDVELDEKNNELYSNEILKQNLSSFDKMSRSHAKTLRNAFSISKGDVEKYKTFLESRNIQLPKTNEKTWYDALEIIDQYQCAEE